MDRSKQNANLKPGAHKLTVEEASKGGKKSAEARAARKTLAETLIALTSEKDREDMALNLIKRAMKNDRSFEVYRSTIGEDPVNKVEQTNIELKPILPKPKK